MNPQSLNDTFAIPNHVQFALGRGDLPIAILKNEHGTATLSIYGGHVLSYEPTGHDPVIWVSRYAKYEEGSAIRGGVPIIFPWFGSHPTDSDKPSHGFARRMMWQVKKTEQDPDGRTRITLFVQDSAETLAVWPHKFELCVTVTLGEKLNVSMAWENLGDAPMEVTSALHTYFAVADSTKVTLTGLENVRYFDQLDDMKRKYATAPINIWQEVDRIYYGSVEQVDIVDSVLQRTIHVAKKGSQSTVVWNPWIDKSARMQDFGDLEYQEMVCVETATVAENMIVLEPKGTHELRQIIWVDGK